MQRSFLQAYLKAFETISGWFQFDAALMFMAYNQLNGVAGHTLEIGVHHGLSAIAIATLRGPGKRFYAIDLFEELQHENVSGSGGGNRGVFEQNMRRFYPELEFLCVLARSSRGLTASELPAGFSFCHVDGGHSREETLNDLRLCHSILMPGGLVALDDYFNPAYPGVSEGAVEFMLGQPGALEPLAIGFNKVLFCKLPATGDLNSGLRSEFPEIQTKEVTLWDRPALLFPPEMRSSIDLYASTPQRLVRFGSLPARASIALEAQNIEAAAGEVIVLPLAVTNNSRENFPAGEKIFGLSYHVLAASGELLRHDNPRTWIADPIRPGESRTLALEITAPSEPGQYGLEIDLVWEQVMWFKDVGNPTALATLDVA